MTRSRLLLVLRPPRRLGQDDFAPQSVALCAVDHVDRDRDVPVLDLDIGSWPRG